MLANFSHLMTAKVLSASAQLSVYLWNEIVYVFLVSTLEFHICCDCNIVDNTSCLCFPCQIKSFVFAEVGVLYRTV